MHVRVRGPEAKDAGGEARLRTSGPVVVWTRRARVGALLALALAAFPACSPPAEDAGAPEVKASLATEPSPAATGPVKLLIALADASGAPVPGAALHVEASMNHAGMPPVLAQAADLGDGRYAAQVELSMGGDWYVLVDATLADGRTLHRKLDLPGVRSR